MSFALRNEAGAAFAVELWSLAKCSGRTPWEALHDPHLRFNLNVMRSSKKARGMGFRLAMQQLSSGDEFGIARVIETLRRVLEEV